jgi:hypothetical protein
LLDLRQIRDRKRASRLALLRLYGVCIERVSRR